MLANKILFHVLWQRILRRDAKNWNCGSQIYEQKEDYCQSARQPSCGQSVDPQSSNEETGGCVMGREERDSDPSLGRRMLKGLK